MKHDLKQVAKLLKQKSTSYLKVSLAFFLASLIIIFSSCIVFVNQYIQLKENFLENDNTHMIQITSRMNQDDVESIKLGEQKQIADKLNKKFEGADVAAFLEYQINFGISDSQGNPYLLHATDSSAEKYYGTQMKDSTIYGHNLIEKQVELEIPSIRIEEGQIYAEETSILSMALADELKKNTVFTLFDNLPDSYYAVSLHTYQQIIELMYGIPWAEFQERFNQLEAFGIDPVRRMFVYVGDITQVDAVAAQLEEMGYNINYTFQAFDHFSGSFSTTFLVMTALLLAIFLLTTVNVILSFHSYIKLLKKDMGILKQYGYSDPDIFKIYRMNLNGIFLMLALLSGIYTMGLGLILIDWKYSVYLLCILAVLFALLLTIYLIVVFILLKRSVGKEILYLLKEGKEFE